jgi:nitroreductase/FMN reductase (NADPH)/FMN reductase [NAD(P)H]
MLKIQQNKSGEDFADWLRRFCKRKWNSDFSREMSRSCTEIVKDWLK